MDRPFRLAASRPPHGPATLLRSVPAGRSARHSETHAMARQELEAHDLGDLVEEQRSSGQAYLEFTRTEALSVGLYVLPAGGVDPQQPHSEDEVYHVVAGWGLMTVAEETFPVRPGSIVYVAATVPHHFHDISQELRIVVFFAPAEGSAAGGRA
jgi:mannose-6-phosphate isomerase-like protein (cupin superfamily)